MGDGIATGTAGTVTESASATTETVSAPAGRLVHMTNEAAGKSISESGQITAPRGLYATSADTADKGGFAVTARTGLLPSQATATVPIPAAATQAFSRPVPIGMATTWQFLSGTQYAGAGTLSLSTGTFVRTGVGASQVFQSSDHRNSIPPGPR